MSGGELDRSVRAIQGEVHRYKSEYTEARNIYNEILQEASLQQDKYYKAAALCNFAQIDVQIGALQNVQKTLDMTKTISIFGGNHLIGWYDCIQADLKLKQGDMSAQTLFQKGLKVSWKRDAEMAAYCLEGLGDIRRWSSPHTMSTWTTVFLAHSISLKQKLEIHKALQFLADVFLIQDDEDTAISLFSLALEGFTYMDVHRSKAECMLYLGDILKRQGHLPRAVEHWETARPLFERSSQMNRIKDIDRRLAGIV
jgi:tetratricopeptide (TPR) repeat protein